MISFFGYFLIFDGIRVGYGGIYSLFEEGRRLSKSED